MADQKYTTARKTASMLKKSRKYEIGGNGWKLVKTAPKLTEYV